ncbi:hypothetical protein H312_00623 [Anncaliia algerae PRA339]|uniref:Uncharacterized protein n=1 Tax=Anncaliia algerae PRA339 TaxID=1288291 RepID=A0A059F458_9MICR|nr:hypothetical protein H312_00623 [Anncaliia algerae PRA339]
MKLNLIIFSKIFSIIQILSIYIININTSTISSQNSVNNELLLMNFDELDIEDTKNIVTRKRSNIEREFSVDKMDKKDLNNTECFGTLEKEEAKKIDDRYACRLKNLGIENDEFDEDINQFKGELYKYFYFDFMTNYMTKYEECVEYILQKMNKHSFKLKLQCILDSIIFLQANKIYSPNSNLQFMKKRNKFEVNLLEIFNKSFNEIKEKNLRNKDIINMLYDLIKVKFNGQKINFEIFISEEKKDIIKRRIILLIFQRILSNQ